MEKMDRTKMAKVVVLIPPVVEPVEPPMSIRQMDKNLLLSVNSFKGSVLKPAVRTVTDWNREERICSSKGKREKTTLFCSNKKKKKAPPKISKAVTNSTNLVCKCIRSIFILLSKISRQTKKPKPPKTIKAIITRFKYQFPV